MSWSNSVNDEPRRATRPGRGNYVPPYLRNMNQSNYGVTDDGWTQTGGQRFNRRGYGDSGRGRGRGGRGWSRDAPPPPFRTPTTNRFDVAEKFDDLKLVDETNKEAGGDASDGGGINFDAYEDIPVEVTGTDIPPPVSTFAEINLGKALDDNIKRCKYVRPTPVQRHAIPIAASGRDLMACAQTGSGKTAAFCFPIISGILKNPSPARAPSRMAFPLALILSPTRELSCQIHDEAKKFAQYTGVKVVVAYGGAPIVGQLRNLEKGVDILVATPGRLVDMIERRNVSLKMIKYLALDEADRMLDMGFEQQIRKIVEQMEMPPPGKRQTLLFSATFPTEIQRLASDFLSNYIFLAVGRVGSSTDLIVQKVENVKEMDKQNFLMDLLNAKAVHGKLALTLVFVETKRGADVLERLLSSNGFPAIAIHGDKVQVERERALKMFKSGRTPVLVATDVASRGLDIPHVAHVINFDMPRAIDDYVHRIGRTGRAGKSGLATAFFNDKNASLAKALSELMKEAKQPVPDFLAVYAEMPSSSYGSGSRQYGGGSRFGGRDFRSGGSQYGGESGGGYGGYSGYGADIPSDSSYGTLPPASMNCAPVGSFADYGYDQGTVVASGWD